MAQRQSVPPLNANIQQSLNQTADAIDGLNRHGRDVQAINFVRPFPRGFTTGVSLISFFQLSTLNYSSFLSSTICINVLIHSLLLLSIYPSYHFPLFSLSFSCIPFIFVLPFQHCLMNNLPYSKADRRATIAAWAITAASFMSAVTYRQWQGGYWFTGRRPDN